MLIQELNNLKSKIKELKKSGTSTKIPQIVRKKDDLKDLKKDSLLKHNEKLNRLKNLEEEYRNIMEEKYVPNPNKILNIEKDRIIDPPILEKLGLNYIEKIMKNSKFYKYELDISDKINKENPKMSAKKIDIINQLKSLYTIRKNYFKIKINDPKSKTPNLRSLDDQIRK